MLLCSSKNAITGGFGQADYSGANAFMDAFARYHTAHRNILTISINWDTWQEVGMAVNVVVPQDFKKQRERRLKLSIAPQEGCEVFNRILQAQLSRVLVSTQGLAFEQTDAPQKQVQASSPNEQEQEAESHQVVQERSEFASPYVAPRNEMEQCIAEIWGEQLGIDQISIYDNFYELGGHSLLAIQTLAQLHEVFQVECSLSTIIEYPTIASLAEILLQKLALYQSEEIQNEGQAEEEVITQELPAVNTVASQSSLMLPRSPIEQLLALLWRQALDTDQEIVLNKSFFAYGGERFSTLHLLENLKELFNVEISLNEFREHATIQSLIGALRQRIRTTPWFPMTPIVADSPIVSLQQAASSQKASFFCVHPVGGDVSCYAPLTNYLGADQPLYGFQARGMRGEQAPSAHIESMASDYVAALRRFQPKGPYLLGGYSLGGLVAFEMAQQLRVLGEEIPLLVLFDTPSHWVALPSVQRKQLDRARSLVSILDGSLPGINEEDLRKMPVDEQLLYVLKALAQKDKTPLGLNLLQHLDLIFVFEENHRAIAFYEPRPYTGPLTLFYGQESYLEDPTDGVRWSEITGAKVEVRVITGNHMTMFSEPHIQMLASFLDPYLQRVQAKRLTT